MKVVSAVVVVFVASLAVAQAQQTETWGLSDADKSDVIKAVLNLSVKNPDSIAPHFPHVRTVSSANIDFIDPSRLRELGFTVVTSTQLSAAKKDHIVDYLEFKQIHLRDGVARVVVWRIREGRGCFSGPLPPLITTYTFESRLTSIGWSARLIGIPSPPMLFVHRK